MNLLSALSKNYFLISKRRKMKGTASLKGRGLLSTIMALLVLFSTVSVVSAAEIIIYKRVNFKGKSVTLVVNASDLRVPSIDMNDEVRSMQIKNATSVAMFSAINYKGKCETFTTDVANLKIREVGILGISSIKINATCPEKKPGVIFYEKKNYNGQSKRLTENTHVFPFTPLQHKILSLKLDGVSSVAVFSSTSFSGNCEVFTSDQPNLSNTNIGADTIESVKINGNCKCSGPYMFLFENNNYSGRRYRLIKDSYDLSNPFSGNIDNKVSSIKMFNMNSAALYSDKSHNGKCHTIKNHIPQMASTIVGNDALSSIKFNAECNEERYLRVRNNSAAIVKFSWKTDDPLLSPNSVKLAVGQEKIFNYKTGTKIDIIVYYAYPQMGTIANAIEYKEKCNYSFRLNDNHFIVARGTLFNPNCSNSTIPTF